jgi:hypothetical protein
MKREKEKQRERKRNREREKSGERATRRPASTMRSSSDKLMSMVMLNYRIELQEALFQMMVVVL